MTTIGVILVVLFGAVIIVGMLMLQSHRARYGVLAMLVGALGLWGTVSLIPTLVVPL